MMKKENKMLLSNYRKEYLEFMKSSRNCSSVQRNKLLEIIFKNKDTYLGKKYGFKKIRNVKDFQNSFPLTDYEFYKGYIKKTMKGRRNLITRDKIILLEPTSGSTSASKLIPYTDSLKKEFMKGIAPWIYSMGESYPGVLEGKQYWLITPPSKKEYKQHDSRVKIGFEDDSYYLENEKDEYSEMGALFPVPREIKYVCDFKSFRYLTQLFLIREKNISLISLWNPSMIRVLFEDFDSNFMYLCEDIEMGKFRKSLKIPKNIKPLLLQKNPPDRKRSEELREIYFKYGGKNKIFRKIFGGLKLISCWTDASAKLSVHNIKEKFPGVEIQPKGLISTECLVSFPFKRLKFPVLSVNSHFFEFIELGKNLELTEKIALAHELKNGKKYCVAVTTSGGLYRYNLKDVVKVKGFYNKLPLLEFEGKIGNVSDIVGEKLNEVHVKSSVLKVLSAHDANPKFAMLAPEKKGKGYFYALFLQTGKIISEKKYLSIRSDLENELSKNYHYACCIETGQLMPLKIFLIKEDASTRFITERKKEKKTGNIKDTFLSKELGWSKHFKGGFK